MSSTTNTAAWITSAKAHPFEVKPAPIYQPSDNEILVRNYAVAINPIDGGLQATARFPLNYPTILGQDLSGTVASTGPDVTRFKAGDRVLGHCVDFATKRLQENAFQAYSVLQSNMAAQIPDNVSFENAAVVPLGCSTACCGLFQDTFLKLQYPTEPAQKATGQTLLVWGGASSVGSNATQLGVAAGYKVFTTASAQNFGYVKKLGASQVFDYHDSDVGEKLVDAFKGKRVAGALNCVGGQSLQMCIKVMQASEGNKSISTVKPGYPEPPKDVTVNFIFGTTIKDNQVGDAVYGDFLPKALKAGTFVPAPEPLIAGKGLESVQAAVDLQQKGVSAKKVVVSL